jgi:hypothetical protein
MNGSYAFDNLNQSDTGFVTGRAAIGEAEIIFILLVYILIMEKSFASALKRNAESNSI